MVASACNGRAPILSGDRTTICQRELLLGQGAARGLDFSESHRRYLFAENLLIDTDLNRIKSLEDEAI